MCRVVGMTAIFTKIGSLGTLAMRGDEKFKKLMLGKNMESINAYFN